MTFIVSYLCAFMVSLAVNGAAGMMLASLEPALLRARTAAPPLRFLFAFAAGFAAVGAT